jgi:hypothetical protein
VDVSITRKLAFVGCPTNCRSVLQRFLELSVDIFKPSEMSTLYRHVLRQDAFLMGTYMCKEWS